MRCRVEVASRSSASPCAGETGEGALAPPASDPWREREHHDQGHAQGRVGSQQAWTRRIAAPPAALQAPGRPALGAAVPEVVRPGEPEPVPLVPRQFEAGPGKIPAIVRQGLHLRRQPAGRRRQTRLVPGGEGGLTRIGLQREGTDQKAGFPLGLHLFEKAQQHSLPIPAEATPGAGLRGPDHAALGDLQQPGLEVAIPHLEGHQEAVAL